jgi:hypothetical protein
MARLLRRESRQMADWHHPNVANVSLVTRDSCLQVHRSPKRPRGRIWLLVCARGPDLVPRLSLMAAFGVPARRYTGLVYRVVGENLGHVIGCGTLSLRRRNGNPSRLGIFVKFHRSRHRFSPCHSSRLSRDPEDHIRKFEQVPAGPQCRSEGPAIGAETETWGPGKAVRSGEIAAREKGPRHCPLVGKVELVQHSYKSQSFQRRCG